MQRRLETEKSESRTNGSFICLYALVCVVCVGVLVRRGSSIINPCRRCDLVSIG